VARRGAVVHGEVAALGRAQGGREGCHPGGLTGPHGPHKPVG
jgi:hypothetical protein